MIGNHGVQNIYFPYLNNNFSNAAPISAKQINYLEQDSFIRSNDLMKQKLAESFKKAGDDSSKNKQNKKAIEYYNKAIDINPTYTNTYFNLARTYKNMNQNNEAIATYDRLIKADPKNAEAMTYAGELYKDQGEIEQARDYFTAAVQVDSKFDLASRSLKQIDNELLAQTNPAQAQQFKNQHAERTLNEALKLVKNYGPKEYVSNLDNISLVFSETDALSGHQNIAQWENDKKRIVITDKYLWAAPNVIAAYVIHEAVHAKDTDSYTSIKEEQTAYEKAVQFWIAHNEGYKDPEMDYATALYNEHPKKLAAKVREIYASRDNGIPENSPNHLEPAIASQSITVPDVNIFAPPKKNDSRFNQSLLNGYR